MPRYQPLTVDSSNQAQPQNSIRNPFLCAGCSSSIFSWIEELLGPILPNRGQITGYTAGVLFAIGWWMFIDASAYNGYLKSIGTPGISDLAFEDWIPGIVSTFALVLVNLIDRETLNADDSQFESTGVAWKARACAFMGVTLALGALGGALAILSLKFIIPGKIDGAMYLGKGITIQNFLIFASSMILWFGRNTNEDRLQI